MAKNASFHSTTLEMTVERLRSETNINLVQHSHALRLLESLAILARFQRPASRRLPA